MRALSWIFLLLGISLVGAGVIYGLHSGDYDGLTLLVTTAGGALLVGSSMIRSMRGTLVAATGEVTVGVSEREPHVGPTIWPLVLSVAMAGLVVGALISPWALIGGGVVLVAAGVGWLHDVHHQWLHHYLPPADPDATVATQEH